MDLLTSVLYFFHFTPSFQYSFEIKFYVHCIGYSSPENWKKRITQLSQFDLANKVKCLKYGLHCRRPGTTYHNSRANQNPKTHNRPKFSTISWILLQFFFFCSSTNQYYEINNWNLYWNMMKWSNKNTELTTWVVYVNTRAVAENRQLFK